MREIVGMWRSLPIAAAALCAAGAAEAAPLASHEPTFFEKLLAGRAYVYTFPWRRLKSVAGVALRPGGEALICTYRGDRRVTNRARWRVLPSGRYRALFSLYWDGDDPRDSRFRAAPIYDGVSGRLHKEAWNSRDLRYATRYDGWVQESWPRVLAAGAGRRLPRPGRGSARGHGGQRETDRGAPGGAARAGPGGADPPLSRLAERRPRRRRLRGLARGPRGLPDTALATSSPSDAVRQLRPRGGGNLTLIVGRVGRDEGR